MSEPFIIEQRYCIKTGDINVVGEMLGYDWNDVCDMCSVDSLYGQDGSGFCTVERGHIDFESEGLVKIFEKLFADNPDCKQIYILNDW